jgi:hypothetical protein
MIVLLYVTEKKIQQTLVITDPDVRGKKFVYNCEFLEMPRH